jgi:hypothetical protein
MRVMCVQNAKLLNTVRNVMEVRDIIAPVVDKLLLRRRQTT